MKKKINASLTTRARNKNTHPDDIRKQLTKHTPASNAGLIDGERRIRSRGIRRKHISALTRGEGDVLNPQCIGGYKINYNIGHKWPILFYPVLRHGWDGISFSLQRYKKKIAHMHIYVRFFLFSLLQYDLEQFYRQFRLCLQDQSGHHHVSWVGYVPMIAIGALPRFGLQHIHIALR